MLITLIGMFGNMSDPDAFGPMISVALIPVLYGAVLAEFVFSPLEHAVNDRIAAQHDSGDSTSPQRSTMGAVALTLVFFLMFLYVFGILINIPPPNEPRAILNSPLSDELTSSGEDKESPREVKLYPSR